MTDYQNKMFEENQNLIYTTINTYVKCPGMYGLNDYDDLFQIGAIGMCKAIENYDESKGAFSTYAIPIIRNHLYNALRDATSIDTISTDDEWVELNIDIAQESTKSVTDNMILKQGFDIITECGSKYGGIAQKGAEAIKMMMLGYDCGDIAMMYGVEPKTITSWISRARKKLQCEPSLKKLLDLA